MFGKFSLTGVLEEITVDPTRPPHQINKEQ